jgi:hypothetical protein
MALCDLWVSAPGGASPRGLASASDTNIKRSQWVPDGSGLRLAEPQGTRTKVWIRSIEDGTLLDRPYLRRDGETAAPTKGSPSASHGFYWKRSKCGPLSPLEPGSNPISGHLGYPVWYEYSRCPHGCRE